LRKPPVAHQKSALQEESSADQLCQAYTHARNAAQETKRSNPVAASEEHDLAAAEFAAAAATTTDKEAA